MKHLNTAKASIANLSLDEAGYKAQSSNKHFNLLGSVEENSVFVRDEAYAAHFRINFNRHTGCRVFVGRETKGEISVNFNGNNSTLYIGDNCDLKQLQIRSRQSNDFIAIGDEVSVAGNNVWVSGYGAGNSAPAIIIGDDCMLSYDIVIRNSDAHPIFDADTHCQVNEPRGLIHLEPHVWVGERANILKDTTIGACSIIALGSTVTKSVPRFSTVKGVPGIASNQKNAYWARDHSDFAIQQAKYYRQKYLNS